MEKYSYFIVDILFLGPALFYAFLKFRKVVRKNILFIIFSFFFGFFGFWVVDPVAISWGAWGYDVHKTLGVMLPGGSVIEELLWALLVAPLLGILVSVFAEREEKGKSFVNFFKR